MRIIKEGNLPEAVCTCRRCGCVFAYDERDTEKVFGDGMKLIAMVRCPYCNRHEEAIL